MHSEMGPVRQNPIQRTVRTAHQLFQDFQTSCDLVIKVTWVTVICYLTVDGGVKVICCQCNQTVATRPIICHPGFWLSLLDMFCVRSHPDRSNSTSCKPTQTGLELLAVCKCSQQRTMNNSQQGQLSLVIHLWVGAMSTSQRAVMPSGWGVKAGMVQVWVAGKTVRSPCYTRVISEHRS